MNVALWADIRRLAEIEKLSGRAIARRLHCSRDTVAAALNLKQPPTATPARRQSLLDPYRVRIQELLAKDPDLSAVRIREEIARAGYAGSTSVLRRYLRQVRPARGRVYQEVHYEPGQAMQIDWGDCGSVQVGSTKRKVSVFVAVLCYSRLLYIEFTLSQRKAEFYRGLVNALTFFGGSPRAVIFDNLKAAVLNGSGRNACFHPEFLALCGYFCMQPIACAPRDPESKGIVEGGVRYVKHNALAGRADELLRFEDYLALAPAWRDQVANVRLHESTRERPLERFEQERKLLRPLPAIPFDTDEVVPAVVSPHARIAFDGNRYSAPPQFVRKPLTLRASRDELRLLHEGRVVAQHVRFNFPKRVPKTAIVRLFDCDFIPRHGCAVLIGPTGTGKTHLLTALGYTAAERGYSVRYTRVVDMLNQLTTAQINGRLADALKTYVRPQILLLDELGYLPIDKRGADLLFQVVAARYESGSIVLTTNRTFREWGTLFDVDNTLATALIDRLMHHGEALVIKGDSYRMKDKPPDPPSA